MRQNAPGLTHFTFNAWTSSVMRGFLSIMCHFLDSEWKIHANMMSFHELDGPHMGKNIRKALGGN